MKKLLFLLFPLSALSQDINYLGRNGEIITGKRYDSTAIKTALDLKAPIASPAFTGTVSGVTAAMVGLGNVENTALSTWAGSTNITTLGTIATGSWNASVIPSNKGGAGSVSGVLLGNGSGTVSAATAGDISGAFGSQPINRVYASPASGGSGSMSLRQLVVADINATGTPSGSTYLRGDGTWSSPAGSGDALTANPLSQFAATTSSQLAGVLSDETGTGNAVYSTDAALVTPTLDYTASPATPATDKIKLFDYKVGGRDMPGYVDPSGLDNALQPLFGRNAMKIWQPAGNSTTITAIGAAALTATGTATGANVATTNRHTQIRGLEYLVTVAATTAVAGFRDGVAQYFMGNSAGNGGFHFVCRFGPATGVATTTHRLFVGLTSATAAPTDVQPSSLLNMFGVGYDAADANIQFMSNDGSGTATKTSLGIAVPTADRTSVYELAMFCAPNSTTLTYTFKDLAQGGSTVSGTVTTDLPAVNTFLAARGWMSAGGTSSVIGIALKSLYIESDY